MRTFTKTVLLVGLFSFPVGACGDAFTAATDDGGGGDGGPPSEGGSPDGPIPPVEGGLPDGPLPPVPIAGRVIDPYLLPVAGVVVRSGKESATTAPDGSFSLSAIDRPYNVFVFATKGAQKRAYGFMRLRRADPTLQLTGDSTASVSTGSFSGGVTMNATANDGDIFAELTNAAVIGPSNVAIGSASATYSLQLQWGGPSPANATLYALEWEHDTQTLLPKHYTGYSSTTSSVSSGQTTLSTETPSGNVNDGQIKGTLTSSGGYLPTGVGLYFRPGPNIHTTATLASDRSPATHFQYVTPVVPGGTIVYCAVGVDASNTARTSSACKVNLDPQAQNIAVDLPGAPTLSTPPDNAGAVGPATVFAWAPFSGGLHLLSIQAGNSDPKLVIVTTEASMTLPDLAAYGFSLPSATQYSWSIAGLGPFATIDMAAGPDGYLDMLASIYSQRAPLRDGVAGGSDFRHFTPQ